MSDERYSAKLMRLGQSPPPDDPSFPGYPERGCTGHPRHGWCGKPAAFVAGNEDGEWFACVACADRIRVDESHVRLVPIREWFDAAREAWLADDAVKRLDPGPVRVGQVWRFRKTAERYRVSAENDSRESPGSWVMYRISDRARSYMHRSARERGYWVLVEDPPDYGR